MSSEKFSIELKDLHFHAFHGLYPEEKLKGGQFIVTLRVDYRPISNNSASSSTVTLDDTIDYAVLFEICQKEMSQPTELLENVALAISKAIQARFSVACYIELTITKCKPPIPRCTGSSRVTYKWEA
ncbi:MAG: dihydroneopterin aldolase [Chitinophagaceae bacterium]